MKFSLSKINFLNLVATIVVFALVAGFFVYKFADDFYNNRINNLEKRYIESNKNLIVNEVEKAIKRAENIKKMEYVNTKENLQDKVNFIQGVLKAHFVPSFGYKKFIKDHKRELDLYKWDNKTGYIYIFDYTGEILYHGYNTNFIGKNIEDLVKNNKDVLDFLDKTLKKDENYGSYNWIKPMADTDELFKKYVYIKKDKKLKIYIAAGIYKDEVDKKARNAYLEELKKDRFGESDYGYFWVQSADNRLLMNPLLPDMVGKKLDDLKSYDNKSFATIITKKALTQGKGFASYKWLRADKNGIIDEKTSYFRYFKDWKIIVGAGFYTSELNSILEKEQKELKKLLHTYIMNVLSIMIILTVISILLGIYVYYRIKGIEIERGENINMLEQYKMILDETSVVSKSDTYGVIRYINDKFQRVSGFTKEDIIGKNYRILRHLDNPKIIYKELWTTIKKGKVWKGVIKNRKKDGDSYYSKTTIVPIKDSSGNIIEYISSATDVTELIENRTKLNDLFKNDPLTGLRNRVSLINSLVKDSKGTLALLNIDRFKEINDSFSHAVGDLVIKELANRLFDFFNDKEYKIYRVQADVFAIYTQKDENSSIIKKLERFMDSIGKNPYKIESQCFMLSYTCGVASNNENLFTYAEVALNEAKNRKIKIKEYDDSMSSIECFRKNIMWVEKLHQALAENRIIAHYQPIYNYQTGKIEKYEALMRLIEDDKIIYPNEYLGIAKKTRLYSELTYKMVERVLSKFSNIDKEFSINLCVEDLLNEELMTYLYDFAEQKNVFEKMVLEIVESEEIEDSTSITNLLKKFKDRGCKIAIDDFGSGYSNYDYLIKLQADYIKIDGSIIKHLLEDEKTQNLVKSIVGFAKKSNMKVIAEFVSSKELDAMLREFDIDYAQGFYYGKPQEELVQE